jgi:uncharacterized protein YjbI with pentapeptide repeats
MFVLRGYGKSITHPVETNSGILCSVANPEQLKRLAQGADVWNAWRKRNRHSPSGEETVDLSNADLRKYDLRRAYLSRTNLSGSCLAGVSLHGAMLHDAYCESADLRRAILRQSDCGGSDFSGANLERADLSFAKFQGAVFRKTRLTRARATGSSFTKAAFLEATLDLFEIIDSELFEADFRDSDLRWARLVGCNASGSNWAGAQMAWKILANMNLRSATGLEAVRHSGPSTIGTDTLLRSADGIPKEFLRGTGVPEPFISYANSLAVKAIEFFSCFISYSTKDQAFADRLYRDLQAKGVRCWFAPHDIRGGKKLHEQIDEAIHIFDRLLLILSENSMGSEWVKTEIANARQREVAENRQMLFPISLVPFDQIRLWKAFDADTGKDSAREVREYFIPDFSNWGERDCYEPAFRRLLRDLKQDTASR